MKANAWDTLYGITHPIESIKAVGRQIKTDMGLSGPPAHVDIEDFVMMRPGQAARAIAKAKEEDKEKTTS